jgi:hypothetical protein
MEFFLVGSIINRRAPIITAAGLDRGGGDGWQNEGLEGERRSETKISALSRISNFISAIRQSSWISGH